MKNKNNIPFAYFLTFRTYGSWLHGDPRLSVDPKHNIYGTPRISANLGLLDTMKKECKEDEFILETSERNTVLESIIETCNYNHWYLHAAHVRTNHVHIILQSNNLGKKTIAILKTYATKALKRNHSALLQRKKYWSKGGSAKFITGPDYLPSVMDYVIEQQGERMALYYENTSIQSWFRSR
jgi:REP element-mobilizing transposase RayT